MVHSYKAASDIEVLTSNFPIPGYGLVPINAFVIKGSEPVLVDTGTVVESRGVHARPCGRSSIPPTSSGSGSPIRTSTTSAACTRCSPRTRRSG